MQEFLSWERLSLHLGQFQISGICGMLAQVLLLDLFLHECILQFLAKYE